MEDDRWPKIIVKRMVVWLRGDTSDVVNDKIGYAFRNLKSFPLKRMMIQFWRPVKTTAWCRVLSCSDNPCAYPPLNDRLGKYRSRSCKYYYVIDECSQLVDDDPMTITGAPPSTAFLNHFPEVVMDLRVHRGTPLVDLALECELTCFIMLPVFNQTSCVGVIEVSMRYPGDLLVIFNELNHELKRVGLCINPPRPLPLSWKAITGDKKLSTSEVEKALQMTFQLHAITLGQLWICYENYHRKMRRTILAKLKSVGDQLSLVKQFYDNIYLLPMEKGEGGLIGRTFETHQSHICRNIYKLSDNKGVYALLSANIKCTCFLICLRSSHTGELDYVLEFFWPQSRNHLSLMKELLLTLKEYLPSFKYASGAQLGDELLVVDVRNSFPGSGNTTIKIFEENEKTIDLVEGQSELNQYPMTNPEREDDDEEEEDLVILAIYKVEYKLLFLPSSATFENVLKKIKQEFELLNPDGSYKMEYQVIPGEWYSPTDDTCLKSCISSYQTSNNNNHIKLGVLDVEK